jgi:hypothetical protein
VSDARSRSAKGRLTVNRGSKIESSAENRQVRMAKLRKSQSFGRFFAASREEVQEVSRHLNVERVRNPVSVPIIRILIANRPAKAQ